MKWWWLISCKSPHDSVIKRISGRLLARPGVVRCQPMTQLPHGSVPLFTIFVGHAFSLLILDPIVAVRLYKGLGQHKPSWSHYQQSLQAKGHKYSEFRLLNPNYKHHLPYAISSHTRLINNLPQPFPKHHLQQPKILRHVIQRSKRPHLPKLHRNRTSTPRLQTQPRRLG